jgi:hypothetical protein
MKLDLKDINLKDECLLIELMDNVKNFITEQTGATIDYSISELKPYIWKARISDLQYSLKTIHDLTGLLTMLIAEPIIKDSLHKYRIDSVIMTYDECFELRFNYGGIKEE